MVEAMNNMMKMQYTPQEADVKRKEIYEDVKAKIETKDKDASQLTVSLAPELKPERAGSINVTKLERNPKEDIMFFRVANNAAQPKMMMASMTPQEATQWIVVANQLADLVAKFGPKVIDFFGDMFKPNKPAEAPKPKPAVVAQNQVAPSKSSAFASLLNEIATTETILKDLDPKSNEYAKVQSRLEKLYTIQDKMVDGKDITVSKAEPMEEVE